MLRLCLVFHVLLKGLTRLEAAGSAGQILASNARKVAQKTEPIAKANRDDFSELVRWPRSMSCC